MKMESLNCHSIEYETIDIENETNIDGATQIKLKLDPITDSEFPTVSIVVPTCNRTHFFELIKRNWERIDYPREKLELVIFDDTPGKSSATPEIFKNNPQIRYFKGPKKLTIGQKRNILCQFSNNEYIVHMDDDDWYPPESVACRIRILLDFQKKYKKLGCFGCTKVLCLDLIGGQMFEAFDESKDGTPATISESTMAYSRKYYQAQKWNDESVFAECLPFIKDRTNTVCTGPSVFIVTQFSHGSNTVQRRINRSLVSEYNFIRFEQSLSVYDVSIYNKIRASVIQKIPNYRDAIEFVTSSQNLELENFKKKYKYLDQDVKANPLVVEIYREKMFTKTTTTGKDIVYYCGPGTHLSFSNPWNPESKQLGGSEEAVINLSNQLASYNYNITVYCVLAGQSKKYNKVTYKPYYEWVPKDHQDITIIWRDPSNCKQPINSKKIFLDIHDALVPRWLEDLPQNIQIMTKSIYHSEIIKRSDSIVIPNGIYPLGPIVEKVKNLMICTSSPDRCIRALLKALPLIRKEIPDAEIHWAYGFSSGISKGGMEADPRTKKWVEETKEIIKNTPGFTDLGRLTQIEVNQLYIKADLFIYPTRFPEIDCISLTKAMSAGCIPVCTPSGAMSEKLGINKQFAKLTNIEIDYSLKDGIEFDNFVKAIILTLKNPNRDKDRQQISDHVNTRYNWDNIGKLWLKNF